MRMHLANQNIFICFDWILSISVVGAKKLGRSERSGSAFYRKSFVKRKPFHSFFVSMKESDCKMKSNHV